MDWRRSAAPYEKAPQLSVGVRQLGGSVDGLVECLRCKAPIPSGALACPKCPQRTEHAGPWSGPLILAPEQALERAREYLLWTLSHPNRVGATGIAHAQEYYDNLARKRRRR